MSVYGIDLGTTNSCIAKKDANGNAVIIPNQTDSSDTLASVVWFESADNVVVGASAKDMVETEGGNVVEYIKREIGKEDSQDREYFGQKYSAVDISALILKRIKAIAEDQGETVEKVVITCPAYFGLTERAATKAAGEAVGMEVLNLINEPTAAALAFTAGQFVEDRTILVYDLGGGTFDVTVVQMSVGANANGEQVQKVKVVATGGNDRLGGADWDNLLFEHILNACATENGLSVDDIDAESRQNIRSKVEATKKRLTTAESHRVRGIMINGTPTTVTVTRAEFESMSAGLLSQTMSYVETVMNNIHGLQPDTVLLVGGSTLMPMIRNAVEARFPGIVQTYDPHTAVARGAAIYADMLVEEEMKKDGDEDKPEKIKPIDGDTSNGTSLGKDGGIIQDVTPRTFGPAVIIDGEYMIDNLIKINTPMPAAVEKTYYTVAANQTKIMLRVFENMSAEEATKPCLDGMGEKQECNPADMVRYLGVLEMTLPANTPKGAPIAVTFQVSASGIYIKAVNVATGEAVEATIEFEQNIKVNQAHIMSVGVEG